MAAAPAPPTSPQSGQRPLVRPAKGMARPTTGLAMNPTPLKGSSGTATISKSGVYTPSTPPPTWVNPNKPPTPTATPAAPAAAPPLVTPDLSGDNWKAYLTPDQLGAMNTLANNTSNSIGADQRKMSDAQGAYNTADAQAQYTHDQNISNANDQMAGRGMFLSSIRGNDLTDIDRTLVNYRATATANLNSLIQSANADITNLGANWNTALLAYQGDAAAQVPTPVAGPAAPAPAAAPPLPPAHGIAGLPTAPGIVSRATPVSTAGNQKAPIKPPAAGVFGKTTPAAPAKPVFNAPLRNSW